MIIELDRERSIYDEINDADGEEITEILDIVLHRYKQLYPQWSVSVVSIDKCEDKNEQIDRMIAVLEKMKEMPYDPELRLLKG